ncbi:MAG: hypothetical protein OEZ13_00195 [Spirochaetia bacterium]|nr:hypothetical protein [Spirochaetia bacterium]
MDISNEIESQFILNASSVQTQGESLYGQDNKESLEQLEKKYEFIYNNPQKKTIEASSIAIQLGLRYMESGNYQKALEVMERIKNKVLY